jgi:hypothetical protein
MKLGISVRIDVTKIDKSRLYKGEKGTYLDLTTIIDLENQDQYGNNGFIAQSVTKEEREQKVQTPILGNTKVFWRDSGEPQAQQPTQQQAAPSNNFDDDIPF